MVVTLGEIDNKVIVAMLDADNIQAVDFLQNKIGRPIKVYAASEKGLRTSLNSTKLRLMTLPMSNIPVKVLKY